MSDENIIPSHFQVLILDNNKDIAELLGSHLCDLNHYLYDVSHTLEDAKNKISTKDYDLLLLDWNLDNGTCFDLIDTIRSLNQSKHQRVKSALTIVITGRDSEEDKKRLKKYDIHDHFIKPFVASDFKDLLTKALKRHLRK